MTVTFYTVRTRTEPFPPLFFEAIAEAFAGEEHLLPATAVELKDSFDKDEAAVGTNESDEPVAITRLIPLFPASFPRQFYELGSTWVRADHRGKGLNHDLYRFFLPHHVGKDILATTTNEKSVTVGQDIGFVLVPRRALPEHVWKASCICSEKKTGCANRNQGCKLAYTEPQQEGRKVRWFRVTRGTAIRLGLP